ncbi:MAG: GLUG motif-containing protein, partial [Planctomycetota bacterium]
ESVGGLIGHNGRTVTGCYSTGSVIGRGDYSWRIGGLIGRNGGHGSIINSYSIGSVAGDEHVGGLVGGNESAVVATIVASYWDIETSGKTAQMQMAITFLCWSYEPVWTIDEGVDYPRLVWENKPGELITVPSDLYGGGTGEPEDPYLIYTAEQLNMIGLYSCHLDKHFKLMADIDLGEFTETSFNIIGTDWYNAFTGVFDGNGRKIFNFIYTSTGRSKIGLFGCIFGPNAEVKNLGLIDPNVDAATVEYVGSLVGLLNYHGTITNCYVEGGSVEGDSYVGGLVGRNWHSAIASCYTAGSVMGWRRVWRYNRQFLFDLQRFGRTTCRWIGGK